MGVPKLLLLTGVAPGRGPVGRIYLRDLCLLYPRDRLCCIHHWPISELDKSPKLRWLPTTYLPVADDPFPPYHTASARRVARAVRERLYESLSLPRLADQVVGRARAEKVEQVWATLHTPTTYRLANLVATRLGVPLVTTVWDPPHYKMTEFRPDRFTLARLLRAFVEDVRGSVHCGVASGPMQQQFESTYGTQCSVMVYPQQRPVSLPLPVSSSDAPFVLGFSGSLYATDAWQALLATLAEVNWTIAGRRIILRVLSARIEGAVSSPAHIEFLGWHETDQIVPLLAQMNAAYLPYWFETAYAEAVQYAFPGKLAAYVAARLPILYHGPAASSVMVFMRRYPVGVPCHSLDPRQIAAALGSLVDDDARTRSAQLACDQAYADELNPQVFSRRFAEILGIEERDLVAPATRRP